MQKPHLDAIRHHAHRQEKAHHRVKNTLKSVSEGRRSAPTFWTAFLGTLLVATVYLNWNQITGFFTPTTKPAASETANIHGFKTGAVAIYRINTQQNKEKDIYLSRIPTQGGTAGVIAAGKAGQSGWLSAPTVKQGFKTAAWITNYLSLGQHLTQLKASQTRILQKSVLTTYYLGEKTVDTDGAFAQDFKMLKSLNNALSVDVFQYLNQAQNRSDALDEYLHLLEALQSQSQKRIAEIQGTLRFLQSDFANQETGLERSEADFFNNLQNFNAPNAEQQLNEFIGLQAAQSETRAKIGAYVSIRDYYNFFLPRLNNLVVAIQANRDALIAGVKVVEIQNMTLPLIIRQR